MNHCNNDPRKRKRYSIEDNDDSDDDYGHHDGNLIKTEDDLSDDHYKD